ncbi:MAG: aminotransferase class I/II-fold pyridoxal phosphate-dependent enzyme [Spirochaetota bacterium]|nr:aminotransferase class I/II-fold pyridoxal phosphate-dependent enzyme [Spirochaetota bacterium]
MDENFHIEPAGRMKRLPPYMFGELNRLKLEKRRKGADVIDFGMGNPDQPSIQVAVDKLQEVIQDSKTHRYSASKGIPHLLKAVSERYKRQYDVDLDPHKEIIATIGSKEGISHLSLALLGPGDSALIPSPAFPIHVWSVVLAGANVITIPLSADKDQFMSDMAHTVENLWPKPKVMFLNYPHNPTTTVCSVELFEEIVAFAKQKEIIVIHDFAYADITFDGYKAPSFLQVKGAKDVGVEFTSMSKSFSMAGWRCGFCVGNEKIVNYLATIKGYYDYGIFTPIQVASIMALRSDPVELEGLAQKYQARRDILVEGLNKKGWAIDSPKATMFVWAPIPERYKDMGSFEFSKMLLEKADVLVSPGVGFGETGEGFVRMSLVENSDRIRQAVRQIIRALEA